MRKANMQRRYFELIAETIRFPNVAPEARAEIIGEFVRALKGTKPRFEAERFREACEPAAIAKAA